MDLEYVLEIQAVFGDLDRMSKIEDHLYLGGFQGATDPIEKTEDFRVILTVGTEPIPQNRQKKGVVYKYINADDVEHQDLLTYFPRANVLIGDCRWLGHKIYVHCMAGVSRSATIVIAYIMHKYRMPFSEAQEFVRSIRPIIQPNDGFVKQLQLFETLGFTLNANYRLFRQYLVNMFVKYIYGINYLPKYFNKVSYFEDLTEDLELGQQYDCSHCGEKLFNQIHIITNSNDPNNVQNCPNIYIEPQEWMKELTKSYDLSNGLIKCSNCKEGKARFEHFFGLFVCNCVDHKNNQSIKVEMITNSFKLHE